jgi:O-antigen/teichoic acid export membrane protein
MPKSAVPEQTVRPRGERFVINVLWSWTGVVANLFVGFIITPYIIRRLGGEQYGIWLQIFSILEYFWFLDLGLNTAVCNFCARFIAVKNYEKINEVMNTSLFYFSMIAIAVWSMAPFLSRNAWRFFKVSPAYRDEFANLILLTAISWGVCIVLHMFVSALDGFQRFDLTSRVWVAMLVLRSMGYFLVLRSGHGLVQMAMIFVGTQILGYVLNFRNFSRVFRPLRISRSYVRLSMFREILRYGLSSFAANSSTLMLYQGGTMMIGHYVSEVAVGFYGLPSRLLQYAVDAVSRIALVTRSNAAELHVTARREDTIALGIFTNRYSLALCMPLSIFLLVYGRALFVRWVGPEMAANAAPLIPVFVLSSTLVMAAQFNSSSILYGLGRHGGYARGLAVEAVLYIGALAYVVPRYGILGAAWVSAVLMIAVRGIYTPWLVSRALECSFFNYMRGIYVRPLLAGVPAAAVTWYLKMNVIPGNTLPQLFFAACLCGVTYGAVAFFLCVAPDHRRMVLCRIPLVGPRLMPGRA